MLTKNQSNRSLQNSLSASSEILIRSLRESFKYFRSCPKTIVSEECSPLLNNVTNFMASERTSRNLSCISAGVATVGGVMRWTVPLIFLIKLRAADFLLDTLGDPGISVEDKNGSSLQRSIRR